jgi:hypothetical protein
MHLSRFRLWTVSIAVGLIAVSPAIAGPVLRDRLSPGIRVLGVTDSEGTFIREFDMRRPSAAFSPAEPSSWVPRLPERQTPCSRV